MDSINSVLINRDFEEPEEISSLKAYISNKYDAASNIKITQKGFVIIVKSSSLANVLRMELPSIKRQLNIENNLFIRVN